MAVAGGETFYMANFHNIAVSMVIFGTDHCACRCGQDRRTHFCDKVQAFVHGKKSGEGVIANTKTTGDPVVFAHRNRDGQRIEPTQLASPVLGQGLHCGFSLGEIF